MKYILSMVFFVALLSLASCGDTDEATTQEVPVQPQEVVVVETQEPQTMEKTDTPDDTDAMMDKQEDTMEKSDDAMMEDKDEDAMMDTDESQEAVEDAGAGTYIAYSPDMVGKTPNTVLFFHADWCPSCRSLDSALSSEDIPAGTTVLKVDYDASSDLKKQYGVVTQHTLVQVDADGNEVKKWVGGNSIDSITQQIN